MPMPMPILSAALPDRMRGRLADAAAVAARCTAEGSIPNAVYLDLKHVVNRAFGTGWQNAVQTPRVFQGSYRDLPDALLPLSRLDCPQVHTAAGMLRKAEACRADHPFRDAVVALLREIAPFAAQVSALKACVRKREPRPPADAAERGYRAPPASGDGQRRVLALLESVTEDAHAGLSAWFAEMFTRYLTGYISASVAWQQEHGAPISLRDYYGTARHGRLNPEALSVVAELVEGGLRGQPPVAKPGHAGMIARRAEDLADMVRRDFVHKNFAKLASIVDRKGNFERGEVVGRSLDLGGLSGTLRLSFADGSSFVAQNAVVWSRSARGTPFRRFPLTFHDAVLPGGDRMPRPDEQRMNEVFAVAEQERANRI